MLLLPLANKDVYKKTESESALHSLPSQNR